MSLVPQKIYVFIDAQNLSNGTSNSFEYWAKGKKCYYNGWKTDMKKLIIYLEDKYRATKVFLFMGDDPKYLDMRKKFESFGYTVVLKPYIKDNKGKTKGNCDAELVLYAAKIEYLNYDKAIVISGDGDFYCLIKDMIKENRLEKLMIPNEFRYSSLYRKISDKYVTSISQLRNKLEVKETVKNISPHRGR